MATGPLEVDWNGSLMTQERYPGEQHGLGLFLEELQPVVARELGSDSLLHHAIRRALATGRLAHLRHARGLFNSLSRDLRQTLQSGIVAAPEPPPKRERLLDTYGRREPQPFIAIDSEIGDGGDGRAEPQVGLRHELLDDVALRVLIRPGSLPSGVAGRLREIADLIDQDRRLLSARYWRAARMRVVTGDGCDNVESG